MLLLWNASNHSSRGRDEDDAEAKARRVVRNNNFTGQTNALDVDKHMYAIHTVTLSISSLQRSGWHTSKKI